MTRLQKLLILSSFAVLSEAQLIDWNTQIKNKPTIPSIAGANGNIAVISGGGTGITGTNSFTFTATSGTAPFGNVKIVDTGDFAGIQFNSTIASVSTKESVIHGTTLASLQVVNNVGTNDLVVFQNGTVRIPHVTTGGSGGTQACFSGSFDLYSGVCNGGNGTFTDMVTDPSCGVSTGNSATTNSTKFAACFAAYPTGNLVLPAGSYNVNNNGQFGINAGAFSGKVYFSPGSKIICSTISTTSGDLINFDGGTNLLVDGFTGTCTSTTPQSRANAGTSGALGFHIKNQTNPTITNTTMLVSPGACFTAETSTNVHVSGLTLLNCSANGSFMKEVNYFELVNTYCNVTFDNCIEVTNYTAFTSFTGPSLITNTTALNSTAHGIAIVGSQHVIVTNSYVNGTCGDGLLVFQDGAFGTAVPTDVRFMGGSIIGAGTYSNGLAGSCTVIGNGIGASTAGDVYFDNINVTTSAGYAGYFSSGNHITTHNVRGYGANVAGFSFLNFQDANIDGLELSDGTGEIFAQGNAHLTLHNAKTHNVNPSNGLNRAIDLESNTWVSGNDNIIEDTQPFPTGYIFLGVGSTQVSPIGISFNVANTPTCTMAAIPSSYSACVQIDSSFVVNPTGGAGSGVTAINTSLIGNVTGVAIITSANSFSNVNTFSQSSAGATMTVVHTVAGGIALAVAGTVNSTFKPMSIKDNSTSDAPGIDLISHVGSKVAVWSSDLTNVALDVSGATINHILSVYQNGNVRFPSIPTGTTGGTQACFDGSLNITSGACPSGGVTAINTSLTGNVTGVAITSSANTFIQQQIIAANGSATVGLLELNDGLSTATGIQIDESSTRIANWNAGPTFSLSVVNSSGTNDFIVLQNAGVRIPHTPGGSGGLAACFDGSMNLYKSTSGSCP